MLKRDLRIYPGSARSELKLHAYIQKSLLEYLRPAAWERKLLDGPVISTDLQRKSRRMTPLFIQYEDFFCRNLL